MIFPLPLSVGVLVELTWLGRGFSTLRNGGRGSPAGLRIVVSPQLPGCSRCIASSLCFVVSLTSLPGLRTPFKGMLKLTDEGLAGHTCNDRDSFISLPAGKEDMRPEDWGHRKGTLKGLALC